MTAKPIMWKPDRLDQAQFRLQVSADLHRAAGLRGYSCMPKRSNIDGRYFAEINQMLPGPRMLWNVAYGTGATPLEAAANGYRIKMPRDPVMMCLYLEIELYLLGETVRIARKAEATLDDLTEIVRSFNVPVPPILPWLELDEDDDL